MSAFWCPRGFWQFAAAVTACFLAAAPARTADAPQADFPTALKQFGLEESAKPAKELISDWQPPKKMIVVVDKPERTAWLQAAVPGVKLVGVLKETDAKADLSDADALVQGGCNPSLQKTAPNLRWIQVGGAGSDQCVTVPGIAKGDIILTNGQKVKSTILAEMAMGYVFTLAKSIDVTLENQRQEDLGGKGRLGMQLKGSTMLVVGLGGAGTEIARMAHDMGMRVIATRNSSHDGPDFVEYVGLSGELPKLIGQADVVMVAAPLTPQTRGLFDAAMFARMKRGAMFVDWTRADIVVPADLAAALASGQVGSAALNWATNMPLPKGDPFWHTPNLLLAPWTGSGGGVEANKANEGPYETELRWVVIRENMRRFAVGDKMYSVFDLARGY